MNYFFALLFNLSFLMALVPTRDDAFLFCINPRVENLQIDYLDNTVTVNNSAIQSIINKYQINSIEGSKKIESLTIKSEEGDILIVLSGSGNSINVVKALTTARTKKLKSYAILAYTGGKCLQEADVSIHFPINDMQIAEDTQLIIGHLCMQWLTANKPNQ